MTISDRQVGMNYIRRQRPSLSGQIIDSPIDSDGDMGFA